MRNFVIGSGYVSFKFKDGVIMACDTQGSYGNLAKYNDLKKIYKLSEKTLVCFSGEISDMQYLVKRLNILNEYEEREKNPQSYHKIIQRIMYSKRSNMDPLNLSIVIGGLQEDLSSEQAVDSQGRVLGAIDHLGNHYFSDVVCSGMASMISLPFLRDRVEDKADQISKEEAIALIEEAMRIQCYRCTRSSNRIQIGIVDKSGVTITEPFLINTKWDFGILEGENVLQQ